MSLQTIQKSKSVLVESAILTAIALILITNTVLLDISFHQGYVGLIIEWCHPDQQDDFCTWFREQKQVGITAQIELGDDYWSEFNRQAIFFMIAFGSVRLFAVGGLLHYSHIQKIRVTTFLMAAFWAVMGGGLFIFGFVDTFYYWFQLEGIPDDLPWLNDAGLFSYAKTWTGDPTVVEVDDLYLVNILGIAFLLFIVWLTTFYFAASGLKKGIA